MGFYALAVGLGGLPTAPPTLSLPDSTSKGGTTATITTNSITAIVDGGLAPFQFAWTKVSGGTISINTPAQQSTAFHADNLNAAGETRTATFKCTVTDAESRTAFDTIVVTIQRYAPLLVTIDPFSVGGIGHDDIVTSDRECIMTVTGGSGSYDVSWIKVTGDAIDAVSPNALSTYFRATGMVRNESRTAYFKARAVDAVTGLQDESGQVMVALLRN